MPTLEDLEALAPGQGHVLLQIIDGTLDPMTFDSVELWVARCFNKPKRTELQMAAINEVLEGFGVEAIFGEHVCWPDAEYVNLGDTYTATVLYDYSAAQFLVLSWGDWIEQREAAGYSYQ